MNNQSIWWLICNGYEKQTKMGGLMKETKLFQGIL